MIDADELLKDIDREYPHLDRQDMKQMVNNQPTAYDIDKVIEQLEEVFDRWGLDTGKKEIMQTIVKAGEQE